MKRILLKNILRMKVLLQRAVLAGCVTALAGGAFAADPTISNITNKSMNEDGAALVVSFTISDSDEPSSNLVVTATSSNTALIPNANISHAGTGSNRSITIATTANNNGNTTITVTVRDSDNNTGSDTFILSVHPVPDAPVIAGSITAGLLDTAEQVAVFSNITITDVDHNKPDAEQITLTLDFDDQQSIGEFSGVNLTPHTIVGTPQSVQTALRAIKFSAFANRVAVGVTETLAISVTVRDLYALEDDLDGVLSVLSVNDAPAVTVTMSPSIVDDTDSVTPFSISISDPDVGESFTVTLTMLNDPTGRYGSLFPSTPIPSGTAYSVATAVQSIRYVPVPNVVAGSFNLNFDFLVQDAHGASASDGGVLTINEVSDPPQISGIQSSLVRTDDATAVAPFPNVLIQDPDREGNELQEVSIAVSNPAFGSMLPSSVSGLTPAAITTWLRSVVFVPNPNSVAVGDVEVVVLTLTVRDDGGNTRFDNQTRVAITGVNGAPVIVGAPAAGEIKSVKPADPRPFDGIYVSDDESTDLFLTIALDNAAKGTLVNNSSETGFGESASGYYVFTNDLAAISNLLNALVFNVNTNYTFPASAFGDTTFTLTVSDSLENSASVNVRIRLEEELQNFLVTRTEDDLESGSLRYAVAQATAGDHITFALPQYPALIRLAAANGAIALNRHVTLKGPGADLLRISGDSDGDGSPDLQLFQVNASVVMEGLTLEAGIAQTGGALIVSEGGALTMKFCVVQECVAALWGGGVDVLGQLTMKNCLIKNNQTAFASGLGGGGVSLYSTAPCQFINTTFSGNQQSAPTGYGGGGALFIENSDPQIYFQVDIQHCTFADNSDASTLKQASALSVITMGSDVRLLNSIFANGTGRNIQLHSGTITSLGGNLSDDSATVLKSGATDATALFTGPGDQTDVTAMNLGPLTQLEGPSSLYPLLAGSAAINAGQNCDIGDDQRGVHRTGIPDSGAYEAGALTRVVINEIQTRDLPDDFIEFYIPRDSRTTDLGGYALLVDGVLRHTFLPVTILPGSGIILADSLIDASGIPVVTPNAALLDLESQGIITLLNPAGQMVASVRFVDNFPDLTAPAYADVSLTLVPQFRGSALLPHSHVLAPPFGGWDADNWYNDNSPGADTANTVFGAANATPVAVNDVIELGEDRLTFIPVLANDLDADGTDILVVTGVVAAASGTTALGADYWMSTNPVTGYSDGIYYDPRTSPIFNSLPNGVEVSDSFSYRIADVGSGSISMIVSTNGGAGLQLTAHGHRLTDGDQVQVYGTLSYDGIYTISSVSADAFAIDKAYVENESSGSWIARTLRGASAQADVFVTVIGANDYPVAGADAFSCGEEDVLRILADPASGVIFKDAALYPVPVTLAPGNLLLNDSDVDTDDDNSTLRVVGVLDKVVAIENYSGINNGTPVTVRSALHGLTTGDQIVISGYSGYPAYNGEHVVTVVDADSFTIPRVYVDNASVKGVWGRLDDGNRLTAVSQLDASVVLDIRVDRAETHLIYNPRGSAVLNAISLGASLVDTFYYAVEDSRGAVSLGRVEITVSGVNELPDNNPDPDSLSVLNQFVTVSNSLSSVLSGLTVVDAVGTSASGGRADVRVFAEGTAETDSLVLAGVWFTKESEVLQIDPWNLLANDSDQDSDDLLRVVAVLNSYHGVGVNLVAGTNILYNAAGSDVMDALAQGELMLDFFLAVITDDHGGFVTNEVVVVVEGVNDTPVSRDDSITIDEDVENFVFDPRAVISTNDPSGRFSYTSADPNDYDVDINGVAPDNALWIIPSVSNIMVSAHGAHYSITNNLISYQPFTSTNTPKHAVGAYGLSLDGLSAVSQLNDAFTYTVSDQSFVFAENDLFRVTADGSGFVLDVMANDRNYNVRGGDLSITAVGVPDRRGEVLITGGGSTLTYTPEINFVGDETFTYTISDLYGNIDKGRVTVRVTTELFNGDLQANSDAYSIAFGETVTLDVLANDNRLPAAGSALIITRLLTAPSQPHITLVNNKIQYAATNAAVNAESFSYEVAGAADGTARVIATVAIRIIDRTKKLPVQNDFFTLPYGSVQQQLNVMANDFILPSSRSCQILTIDSTPAGTVTIDAVNNSLRYTSAPGFIGRDIFGYTITDNLGGTGSGTVTVDVGMPVATEDSYNVPKTIGSYPLNVRENDRILPGAGGTLTITSVTGTPSNGSVAVAGGNLIFTSNGTAGTGTVAYVVSDGVRTAAAAVSVRTVDDGVYAVRDAFRVLAESENVTLPVLTNDRSLPDTGRVLTITAVGTGVDAPDHGGTVLRSADNQSLLYSPAPGFTGEESFTYTMTDARLTATAKVVVKVGLPVIAVNDDRFAVYHEGHLTGTFTLPVLSNDTFLPNQGGLLEIIGVGIEGNAPDQNGTVEVAPDGQSLIYQPDTNYTGTASYTETFTYEAGDGTDARVQGTVVVTVYPLSEGRLPESNPDSFSVARNSTGNLLPVIANDGVMPDTAASWTITQVSDPLWGGVATIAGSAIIYTPRTGFRGTDVFNYDVNNGLGSTVRSVVTVKVGSLLLNRDEYAVLSDSEANELDVLGNDGIMPGPEFTPVLDTNASAAVFGRVSATANLLIYAPSADYTGIYPYIDTVWYGVIDDSGLTQTQRVSVLVVEAGSDQSTATVTFTVTGVNDLPVMHNFGQLWQTTDKQPVALFPQSVITDVDEWGSELLRVNILIDDPVKGALTNLGGFVEINPGEYEITDGTPAAVSAALQGLMYVPVENRITVGTVEDALFTCRVWDPFAASPVVSNVTVRVTPVNDPPVISGTQAGQTVYEYSELKPFSSVNITDVDDLTVQPIDVEIRVNQPSHGTLTSLGIFVDMGAGVYRATGTTAAQVTDTLRSILFDPSTSGRLSETSLTEMTRLTIVVNDRFAPPVADDVTTVISKDAWVREYNSIWGGTADTGYGLSVGNTRDVLAVGSPGMAGGAVSLYYRDAGGVGNWGHVVDIMPGYVSGNAEFGFSLVMQDDLLVVGAPNDNDKGSVFIYQRNRGGADAWGLVTTLINTNGLSGHAFGYSVALECETLVVGAPYADGNRVESGEVYVYERNEGGADNWGCVKSLAPLASVEKTKFGFSVGVYGDRIIVGAPYDDTKGYRSGTAYIFERGIGNAWTREQQVYGLENSTSDLFGFAVDIFDDIVVVGAPHASSISFTSGSAYLYRNTGAVTPWVNEKILVATGGQVGDWYGYCVDIDHDILIVGSPQNDFGTFGQRDGEVYAYKRNEGGVNRWGNLDFFMDIGNPGNNSFGNAISFDQNTLAVCSVGSKGIYNPVGKLNVYYFKFNNAPVTLSPVGNQQAEVLDPFELILNPDVFADANVEEILTLSAEISDSWLVFEPSTATFSGTPLATGTVSVILIATDLDGLAATNAFTVTVIMPEGGVDPHEMWLAENFGVGSSSANSLGQIWAGDADPDEDDHSNDQEYAFVSDPRAGDSTADHILNIRIDSGTGNIVIVYRRRSNDPSLNFVIEKSTDLQTWTECSALFVSESVQMLSAEAEEATVTLAAPGSKCFFHIKVYN